jgi:hypothetical protein
MLDESAADIRSGESRKSPSVIVVGVYKEV